MTSSTTIFQTQTTAAPGELQLAGMGKGQSARIARLADSTSADEDVTLLRLVELGFVPGEQVQMVAKAFPGGHPVAVRLGNTTFALRRHEASLIFVEPVPAAP
jgi:ferrous iron transport protein A